MKARDDASEIDDDSVSQGSFALDEFDLGECVVPLKTNEPPKTNNTLRNVTEHHDGPLPPSPALIKKKNMARLASPMNSPGSRSTNLGGRRALRSSQGSLGGGSLHGRGSSPGALGGSRSAPKGSRQNMSRTRSNSPIPPLLRSSSPGSLGGSLHGRSTSPGPLGGGSHHGPHRPRSNSPGALGGGSLHSPLQLRPRSRSPGTFVVRNRSFRAPRRMSAKFSKAFRGPVSILRRGRFSGGTLPPPPPPSTSPPQSPTGSSSHRRRRLLVGRRVTFWFQDEPSLACSFATEESMQFGDLGLDDSGDVFCSDQEYGLRTLRGELPFIEVMDYEKGEYGLKEDDEDEDEYLVKRFNGSTIHEELGASFGEGNFGSSFTSLLSEDDDEDDNDDEESLADHRPTQHRSKQPFAPRLSADLDRENSVGSFALPDSDDEDDHKDHKNNNNLRRSFYQSEGSFALPDFDSPCRRRRATPPPTRRRPVSLSSSSLRPPEELLTPIKKNNISSESSLDLSSLKDITKANRDSLSETSSESPTGVSDLCQGDDDEARTAAEVEEEDTEHRRLKRSMVSKLVPPIG